MELRQDILEELNLTPLWRLRTHVPPRTIAPATESGDNTTSPELHRIAETATAAVYAPAASEAEEARTRRIAALLWDDFAADVARCTACGLCRTRHQPVPGVGDRKAEWLFVGEAPGAEEDARGEPFVGQAGRLLDSMLQALSISRRQRVYIANVLKCRPPDNRTPTPTEASSCLPYLKRQIALIQPRVIIALGRSAASTLLSTDSSIAGLRGRVHRYEGTPLIVTYHPAYLLRSLPDKAKAWEDLCLASATIKKGTSL